MSNDEEPQLDYYPDVFGLKEGVTKNKGEMVYTNEIDWNASLINNLLQPNELKECKKCGFNDAEYCSPPEECIDKDMFKLAEWAKNETKSKTLE